MTGKTVYFLRHGQTALNKGWVHQYPETMLSEKGNAQAEAAAEHFKNIPLDVIIASPLLRAKQTAAHIQDEKPKVPIEYNALFEELRRPSALWGGSWFTIRSLWTMGLLYLFAGRTDWHHSDEENLEEFHARGRRALEWLADREEKHILVVTHRGFMANLEARIKHDGMDTIRQYRRALWKNVTIGNACYFTALWSPAGENGTTLDGTWTIHDSIICP